MIEISSHRISLDRAIFLPLAVLALCLALSLGLTGCINSPGTTAQPAPMPTYVPKQPPPAIAPTAMQGPDRNPAYFYTPSHLQGRPLVRVALLLPFNSSREPIRELCNSLYNAAQLAIFDFGNPDILLIPVATGGTSMGAQAAAQKAVRQGADLILGPLFAEEVSAVGPVAAYARVPVVAFSSDVTVAGNGVHLLSFPPGQDVERLIDYVSLRGMTKFAALFPQDDYGNRVRAAFTEAVAAHQGEITKISSYTPTQAGMTEPVKQVANYNARQGALRAQRAALEKAGDLEGIKALENADTAGELPYQAIFMPEGGARLQTLAPLLPYYDIDPKKVKYLGTSLWDDASLYAQPELEGGWFPAPAPEAYQRFAARYRVAYKTAPPRIASLAYDGVSLAVALSSNVPGKRFTEEALNNPDGFSGIDGIFRFLPDGRTERGLAIMEIHPGGPVVIDPAPTSFTLPPAM